MMTEQQQERIADLFLKHLNGTLTADEIKELNGYIAKSKAALKAFDTITCPEKLLQRVMARQQANDQDYDAIKEKILKKIEEIEKSENE